MMHKWWRRCSICGRYIRNDNKYGACEYPRYCYEKAAAKEVEPLTKAVRFLTEDK